jgi:biopolymer transport protein ExbD
MEEEEIGFQMAPMIDMVFLLLIFFMCASTLSQKQRAVKLEIPIASKGVVPKDRPDRWIVNILADGTLLSGAAEVTLDQLKAMVVERVKVEPGVKIYLRADANAKHKDVKKVMNAMASAGIDDFIFGVYTPSSNAGGGP